MIKFLLIKLIGRSIDMNALLRDAPIMRSREECARGTGQRRNPNYAAVKDAQVKLRREECAGGMGRGNDAAVKDVQM